MQSLSGAYFGYVGLKVIQENDMGTIYSVSCKDCKVTRDLDKLYSVRKVNNRKDALQFSEELEGRTDLFKEGLLLSFVAEHKGHNIVFFDEHSSCVEELDAFFDENEFKDDVNFWG